MAEADYLLALRRRLVVLVDRLRDHPDQFTEAERARRDNDLWPRRIAARRDAIEQAIEQDGELGPEPAALSAVDALGELEAIDEVAFHLARQSHTSRHDRIEIEHRGYHVVCLAHRRVPEAARQGGRPGVLRYHVVIPTVVDLPPGPRIAVDVEVQRVGAARLAGLSSIKVGTSSFADQARLTWDRIATGVDGDRRDALDEILRCAAAARVDVMVLPELTVPPALRDAAMDALRFQPGDTGIGLLVPGSFHQVCARSGCIYNEAILTDGLGNRLTRHRKLAPFGNRGAPDYEDIDLGDRVTVLVTPIGAVVMAICKDFFDDVIGPLWAQLQPEWILIPSYGEGVRQHASAAARAGRLSGAVVVLAHEQMHSAAPGESFVRHLGQQHEMNAQAPALAVHEISQDAETDG